MKKDIEKILNLLNKELEAESKNHDEFCKDRHGFGIDEYELPDDPDCNTAWEEGYRTGLLSAIYSIKFNLGNQK